MNIWHFSYKTLQKILAHTCEGYRIPLCTCTPVSTWSKNQLLR